MKLFTLLRRLIGRKKRDDAWNERFDNPPANRDNTLPLDPGRSELR